MPARIDDSDPVELLIVEDVFYFGHTATNACAGRAANGIIRKYGLSHKQWSRITDWINEMRGKRVPQVTVAEDARRQVP